MLPTIRTAQRFTFFPRWHTPIRPLSSPHLLTGIQRVPIAPRQWGTPSGTVNNKASHGTKVWATGLAQNYKNNELSYLESPVLT